MFYNRFSRRYFLRGAGASLALPFLPSIMKNAYAATEAPSRYIQVMVGYGVYPNNWFPAATDVTLQGTSGVYAKALSTISGDISQILGSGFTPFKNKMSLVRGLSVLPERTNHNSSFPTCASGRGPVGDLSDATPPNFAYSIDGVLAASPKIYPDPTGKQRHVNFCPGKIDSRYSNFSWTVVNGTPQLMPNTRDTSSLLSKFAALSTTTATVDPNVTRKVSVLQAVYEDYKATRDSTKISTNDKLRLESYMAHIDQTLKDAQATQTVGCTSPGKESEVNYDAIVRNQINVLVAAMACQLTRVGAIALNTTYDPIHNDSHYGPEAEHAGIQAAQAVNVAYLLNKLNSVLEGTGTLLDNSIVLFGNEYGEIPKVDTDPHRPENMPVLLAGGGGGVLQMGYYIDYRKTGGMPYNNLLVTLFNAMGLASADYERGGVVGFGEYYPSQVTSHGFDKYMSTTEKRKPLPFLYKGTALG